MPIRSVLHVAKMTGVAGMENHLLTLLPGLKARGLDTQLIILTTPEHSIDEYAAQMAAAGVAVQQLPIRGNLDFNLYNQLTQWFRKSGLDAVHTHLIHADLHGVLAARRAGIKHVFMTGHNDDPFRRRLLIRLMQRWLWRRVDKGIAISEAIRAFQIKVEGAPANHVTTIRYGIDLSRSRVGEGARAVTRQELGLPDQAPVLGSVCRLVEQKGVSDALRAFWQVSRQMADAHYVIIGDGPLRQSLQAQADGYGLSHRIHFLGWREDAHALMAAFDALIVPSRWEGFGLVVLEAMAAKVPVIASRISALPEIILDGETGKLIPPGDIQGLAQAMIDICMYPAQAHLLGEAGRRRAETEFSAEQMIDRTLQFYADVRD